MSSWIKVGAKCVCVDPTYRGGGRIEDSHKLTKGAVYTISSVHTDWMGNPCVWVEGIECLSAGFHTDRFRPLVTKTIEEDIAMFKRIADTAPSLEDAE